MPPPPGLEELLGGLLSQPLDEEVRFVLDMGVAVAVALVAGVLATRLGLPAVVGYVLGGVVIGPFTPGFVGDVERIEVLAEVGVVLLLFTLGVQLSVADVRRVGASVAVGATAQTIASIALGTVAGLALGLAPRDALLCGAALSVSSTLVLVKVLSARGEEGSLHGRVAIGWSVAQDIITVVIIAMLPALEGTDPLLPLGFAVIKAALFLGLGYVAGARVLPAFFRAVAGIGSPELFLLTVLGTALLAAAISSIVFGLSLALGAFVAGFIVSESDISHQAAAEVIPFRDLFAVLFFVSVGMLVDPRTLSESVPLIVGMLGVVVLARVALVAVPSTLVGLPVRSSILAGAALAQAGEFSFIIAGSSLDLELISPATYNLVLGTAVASTLLSPGVYSLGHRAVGWIEGRRELRGEGEAATPEARTRRHVVVLGGGGTGSLVTRAVTARGLGCVVVDRDRRRLDVLQRLGAEVVFGDAASPAILKRALGTGTRIVVVALPDFLSTRLATERLRRIAPRVEVVARVRGAAEREELRRLGVRRFAEERAEAGIELARQSLQRLGISSQELTAIVQGLHREAYGP